MSESTDDRLTDDRLTDDRRAAARRRAESGRHAATELTARGVGVVALTWVDNSGVTRVKGVPVGRLDHAAAWGVGASPVFDTFLLDDSMVIGRHAGGPVGDLRLRPDLDRLTVLAAQPGWAWAPADRFDRSGAAHPQDVRELVRTQTARLAERGFVALAAVEIEWTVSPVGTDDFVPACAGPAYGMTRVAELSDYLYEVLGALTTQGLVVEQLHPEYAAGQFEVSVAAEDPLGAADTAVLVRETIRAVSLRNALRASFSPTVLAGSVGNGGHVHLSLWRGERTTSAAAASAASSLPAMSAASALSAPSAGSPGRGAVNVMSGGHGPCGLTPAGEAFTAGILARLPALMALGAPSVASYLRLVPSHWAGVFRCWGPENREAAIRLVPGPAVAPGAANIEVKCFDLAANPYLVLAGLLAAGQAGLDALADQTAAADQTGRPGAVRLPELVECDPAGLTQAERDRRGIARLPTRLAESVAAFEADDVLRAAFGVQLHDTIVAVRRGEIALFADAEPAEIAARTRWRH